MKIKTYKTPDDTLHAMTETLVDIIRESKAKPFHLALSGGTTARMLFNIWVKEYMNRLPWEMIHFYWVDERCVSPEDDESNFKHADQELFTPLDIPRDHVHRIWGEQDPKIEAERYSEMVKWELPGYSELPRFDCTLLGIGIDGHTASIFSNAMNLLTDRRCYAVAQHPVTGQTRITMTGTLILKSASLLLPIIGPEKQEILEHIVRKKGNYPASYILKKAPATLLFTDRIIPG